MANPLPYTKRLLSQRIIRHVSNGLPTDEFTATQNEVILLIDQAIAFNIVGMAYANAKIEGALAVPEAFEITYKLTGITQDDDTGYWGVDLPTPPLSLPLGYSINQVYFAKNAKKSLTGTPISAKRLSYRMQLPMPDGLFYWVENKKLWLWATNNLPLFDVGNLYVQMPSVRTTNIDDVMALPEDTIQSVFDKVVMELTQRYKMPQDVIKDGLPAGNKIS